MADPMKLQAEVEADIELARQLEAAVRRHICPECRVGTHRNCVHGSWDNERDVEVPCECGPDCVSFDPLGVTH